ncbi:MAG: ribonuclease P protein component [Phycisphaerales bacterium]|jgi:ribonuclease P protein component|nr:ribonuclease P protein component [Phycisphaerales bacterium]
MRTANFFFPRTYRITKKKDFDRVYQSSHCRRTKHLSIHTIPNDLNNCRIGLSVSKKVGNAVFRNLLKRSIREAFRHLQQDLPSGYDIVVTVHSPEKMSLSEYQHELISTLKEHDLKWKK